MLKAITFDLDGVYFINGKEKFIQNLVSLGVREEEARRVFLKSEEMQKYKKGEMTDQEFWDWAIAEWKLNKTMSEMIKMLIDGYEVNAEVLAVVKKVRTNGYKTLVCSNNFPARINGLQERFKFLDDFDAAVMSYDVEDLKPGKKMLQVLIDKAQVKPEEIFFTDDRQDTIQVAKELGMQTHFYQGFEDFLEAIKKLGVNLE